MNTHAKLVVIQGQASGNLELADVTSLGRSSRCDVSVQDHGVSRVHCEIAINGSVYSLVDLDSTNGTFVNEKRISSVQLVHGDLIRIGKTQLLFETEGNKQPHIKYTEDNTMVQVFSRTAIHSASVHGSVDPGRMIRVLHSIISELPQIMSAPRQLSRLIEMLLDVIGAERGLVLLGSDPASMKVTAVGWRAEVSSIAVSRVVLQRACDERATLLVEDSGRYCESESMEHYGWKRILCAPMVFEDRLLGVIQFDSCTSPTQDESQWKADVELVSAVAYYLANCLHNIELLERMQFQTRMRERMGRYLPRELVNRVLSEEVDLAVGGSNRQIVVLFTDLRGFTAMADEMDPQEVLEVLNDCFALFVDSIFRYGGILDKFIGDGIMAFWGAPSASTEDSEQAVRCALEMLAELEQLNVERVGRCAKALQMGIGVHAGPAVVGNVGSEQRMEYTAIGSTVNLAARLVALAQPGEIILSPEVQRELSYRVRGDWLEPVQVKGVRKPVRPFSLGGIASDSMDTTPPTARRREPRVRTARSATLRASADGDALPSVVRDLSGQGMGLVLNAPHQLTLELGTEVEVELVVSEDQTLRLRGVVRNSRPVAGERIPLMRVGIELTPGQGPDAAALRGWCGSMSAKE